MSKYIQMKSKIKFNMWFIYCCGFQFQDFCQNFFNATNTVQLLMGKIQPNVELTILQSIESVELQYQMWQCLRCEILLIHKGSFTNSTPYWAQ